MECASRYLAHVNAWLLICPVCQRVWSPEPIRRELHGRDPAATTTMMTTTCPCEKHYVSHPLPLVPIQPKGMG